MHFIADLKFFLTLLAVIVHYGEARCLCPQGWDAYGRHCYLYIQQLETFSTAESNCNARGLGGRASHLTSVLDADEAAFLQGYIQGSAWIGLSDRVSEGVFVWLDGQPFGSHTRWYPGEPNNAYEDCVHMGADMGWNDLTCSNRLPYICKMLQRYQYRPDR